MVINNPHCLLIFFKFQFFNVSLSFFLDVWSTLLIKIYLRYVSSKCTGLIIYWAYFDKIPSRAQCLNPVKPLYMTCFTRFRHRALEIFPPNVIQLVSVHVTKCARSVSLHDHTVLNCINLDCCLRNSCWNFLSQLSKKCKSFMCKSVHPCQYSVQCFIFNLWWAKMIRFYDVFFACFDERKKVTNLFFLSLEHVFVKSVDFLLISFTKVHLWSLIILFCFYFSQYYCMLWMYVEHDYLWCTVRYIISVLSHFLHKNRSCWNGDSIIQFKLSWKPFLLVFTFFIFQANCV